MIFARTIGSQRIVAECDASLEPAIGDIFKTFADLDRSGKPLRAGFAVRFGWSMLTLAKDSADDSEENSDVLRICEPGFSGDPLHELNPTLDTTINVLVSQLEWLRRVGGRGEDVLFDQQVLLAPGALTAEEIFALRGRRTSEDDSGWSIAPVPAPGQKIDTSNNSALPIFRLVGSHRGLLSVLTLRAGYLVRFHHGEVTEIDGPDGQNRWRR